MTNEMRLHNLSVPLGKIDVVLDTDASCEVDDQFAIAYLLKSKEKLHTLAIYSAPFSIPSESIFTPKEGVARSYEEVQKILRLAEESVPVFRGSESYLPDEHTPVISPAAADLAERANRYSPENPLYVVAIGAITNVASAILLNPQVAENTVVVWLGGHAQHFTHTKEFNMEQDVAAARVVMSSGVPFVQLPCKGVVSAFTISKPELEYWFLGKNPLADYLAGHTIQSADSYANGLPWTRAIWDITAVGWLLNDNNRFMLSRTVTAPLPTYDNLYSVNPTGHMMEYVYHIHRDALWADVIKKLT